ncbi:MAG: ABC transporter ATP-binding protein [Dehalococcoidia bacterium]
MTGGKATQLPLVSARALDVGIGGTRLLHAIDFEVGSGSIVGLIGPNGAGKSTFLGAIAGVLKHERGTVTLGESDLRDLSAREVARRLALISQHPPETHGFTSLELVLTGRYPHLGRLEIEGQRDREIAHEAMRLTHTDTFAPRSASTLSGGERQRVFIARGLAQQTPVLLLDEPTASLDVQHQLGMFGLFRRLADEGLTVIVAVHDLDLAARYCDRLVMLEHGRVAADGTPEQVLTPERLSRVFGVAAAVYRSPFTQALTVSFDEQRAEVGEGHARPSVHVICGGGSGAGLLQALVAAGARVTVGPLNEGDLDALAADALRVTGPRLPSFSAVDPRSHLDHLDLIAAADWVILADTSFSSANLANLQAASRASRLVSIERRSFEARDHTGGEASRVFAMLTPAVRCCSSDEALEATRTVPLPGKSFAPSFLGGVRADTRASI